MRLWNFLAAGTVAGVVIVGGVVAATALPPSQPPVAGNPTVWAPACLTLNEFLTAGRATRDGIDWSNPTAVRAVAIYMAKGLSESQARTALAGGTVVNAMRSRNVEPCANLVDSITALDNIGATR